MVRLVDSQWLEPVTLGSVLVKVTSQETLWLVMTEKVEMPFIGKFGRKLISKEELMETWEKALSKADVKVQTVVRTSLGQVTQELVPPASSSFVAGWLEELARHVRRDAIESSGVFGKRSGIFPPLEDHGSGLAGQGDFIVSNVKGSDHQSSGFSCSMDAVISLSNKAQNWRRASPTRPQTRRSAARTRSSL